MGRAKGAAGYLSAAWVWLIDKNIEFMIRFSCLLLISLPLIAHGSDVKNLTSINGFEAGMELERFESNLGIAVDHFSMLDPSLTVRNGYKV